MRDFIGDEIIDVEVDQDKVCVSCKNDEMNSLVHDIMANSVQVRLDPLKHTISFSLNAFERSVAQIAV